MEINNLSQNNRSTEMERLFPGFAQHNNVPAKDGEKDVFSVQKERESSIQEKPDLAVGEKSNDQQRLYQATLELQSMFIEQMLGAMRSSTHSLSNGQSLLNKNFQEEIYTDWLYQEYAQHLSKSPQFDLAEKMYDQLLPSIGRKTNFQK